MENTKYGRRKEGRWTPIRAKAQDTRTNPNSWETHLVRKRWDIGLLQALSPRIMMMMIIMVAIKTTNRIKIRLERLQREQIQPESGYNGCKENKSNRNQATAVAKRTNRL